VHDTRRTRLALGVLLVAAIALITLDHRGFTPIAQLRSASSAVLGPVERLASGITRPVTGFFEAVIGAPSARGKVRALEQENQRLRAELGVAQLNLTETAELRRLLQLAGRGRYRIVAAHVIGIGQGYEDTVTIDAGTRDGIRADQTVLNADGLVGRVAAAGPDTSTVLLATDASSAVGGRLEGSGEIGVVRGTGKSLSVAGMMRLELLDANAVLQPGQRIVTLGSVGGHPYVPGVPIGVVTQVGSTPGALTRAALVRPFVHFTSLDVVGVVWWRHGRTRGTRSCRRCPARRRWLRHRWARHRWARHRWLRLRRTRRRASCRVRHRLSRLRGLSYRLPLRRPASQPRGVSVPRLLCYGALVVSALVLQLTVLDTLPFPGGIAPDLVLLVIVAIAVTRGPLPGVVSGFSGGLALDLAPPAVHAVGAYAMVFCLIGYLCGRVAREIERSAVLPLAVMALGGLAGSFLYTVVGVTFGEADVTWAAARHVLPLSVTCDVLLSPFVLYAVMRLLKWTRKGAEDPAAALLRTSATAVSAQMHGRGVYAPRQPRIRQSAGGSAGWIGVGPASGALAASGRSSGGLSMSTAGPPRRAPQLAPPRLRFGPPRRLGATPAERQGVFAGGSLVAGTSVRLRLRGGTRLASRIGQALRLRPHRRKSPRLGLGQARSAMTMSAPVRSGRMPRFGKRRFGSTRSHPTGLRRGGGWLTGRWPHRPLRPLRRYRPLRAHRPLRRLLAPRRSASLRGGRGRTGGLR